MTTRDETKGHAGHAPASCTLVWIDSRLAEIVRWHDEEVTLERIPSDVAAHHKATGHVRHDPAPAAGSAPLTSGEPKRLEHLARFVDRVAASLDPRDDLVILGPGTVRERLERHVRESDRHASRSRRVVCEPARRLTDRQLVTRVRHEAGADALRRTAGPYRWIGEPDLLASGKPRPAGRGVFPKPRPTADDIDEEIADAVGEASLT